MVPPIVRALIDAFLVFLLLNRVLVSSRNALSLLYFEFEIGLIMSTTTRMSLTGSECLIEFAL